MHETLRRALPLDDILVCPHDDEDDCPCRKPQPGLLIEAAFKYHIDLPRSYVVSDKWQDAAAAHAANCTSVLLRSPQNGRGHHDVIRDTFSDISDEILGVRTLRRVSVG
jgi:D-glycero-D-manno-heptose 1,7-bisphosphate phosphatase